MNTSISARLFFPLALVVFALIFVDTATASYYCGNGQREGLEECDNGTSNSDTLPDKCRTDCRLPYCGDGVTDRDEECDDGTHNSDQIPGACRTDCRRAYCGDGVVDPSLSEECDFGIDDSTCSTDCLSCVSPRDNLTVGYSGYTKLCPGEWQLSDNGSQGVLHVSDPYTMLDCNGARLIGDGKDSIGIQVSGEGSVIRNCDLSGFTTGIKITADAVGLYGNRICGNYKDIISESEGHGLDNECSRVTNWQEAGQTGCTQRCPEKSHTPTTTNTKVTGNIDPAKLDLETQQTQAPTSSPADSGQNRLTNKQSNVAQAVKVASTTRNVARPGTADYSFYQMADKARWVSSSGKVIFGSDRIPKTGVARMAAETTQLNGKMVESVLLTQPAQQSGGFIQGVYQFKLLKKNSKFISEIALLPTAPRDVEAKFEVIVSEGKTKRVVASRKMRGGRTGQLEADLSAWSGKKVNLTLRVSSVKSRQAAPPALWVNPRLD